MKNLEERGLDAARSYLERTGMTVVEEHWPKDGAHKVDLIALEGTTLVLCDVTIRRKTTTKPDSVISSRRRAALRRIAESYVAETGVTFDCLRYDRVSILVISEDRALLRHHRAHTAIEEARAPGACTD